MKIPAAAPGHDANLTAGRASIFGVVIRRQNLYFLRRIQVGHANAGAIRTGAHADRAVKGDQIVLRTPAIDVQTACRQAEAVAAQRAAKHARFDDCQEQRIAPVELQVFDRLLGSTSLPTVADSVCTCAVEAVTLTVSVTWPVCSETSMLAGRFGSSFLAGLLVVLEAIGLDRDGIEAGRQLRDDVIAFAIGGWRCAQSRWFRS